MLGLSLPEATSNEYAFTPSDFEKFEKLCQGPTSSATESSSKRRKKTSAQSSRKKGRTSSSKPYLQCTVSGDEMMQTFQQQITDAFVWIGAL
jgi:hypothetical protein